MARRRSGIVYNTEVDRDVYEARIDAVHHSSHSLFAHKFQCPRRVFEGIAEVSKDDIFRGRCGFEKAQIPKQLSTDKALDGFRRKI